MEIKRMTTFFYALSFLCYACIGNNLTYWDTFRGALASTQQTVGSWYNRTVTAGGECVYKCEDGSKPEIDENLLPVSNGCGVPGMSLTEDQLGSLKDITECCNGHDVCYGTCNTHKEKCDNDFEKCMYEVCSAVEGKVTDTLGNYCKTLATSLYQAVNWFGCKYFKQAQVRACHCTPHTQNKQK